MGGEESRNRRHKSNRSFVIREVPIQRTKSFLEMQKAMMMDYDTPEMVVFVQEDRGESEEDKCVMEDCECYEETTETMSSSSSSVPKVADSACRNPRTNGSGYHPTKTSPTLLTQITGRMEWKPREDGTLTHHQQGFAGATFFVPVANADPSFPSSSFDSLYTIEENKELKHESPEESSIE